MKCPYSSWEVYVREVETVRAERERDREREKDGQCSCQALLRICPCVCITICVQLLMQQPLPTKIPINAATFVLFFAKSGSCNLNFQVFLCCHVAAAVVTDFRKFRHTRLINSLKTKFVKGVTVIGSVCTNNLSASLGLNPNWANQLDFFRAQCKRHNWYGFVCQWFAKVCLKRIKNTQKRPEPWLWWK